MKKLIIILCCMTLLSCGGVLKEGVEYEICTRVLNSDDSYDYNFHDDSIFLLTHTKITSTEKFQIGEKFTVSINRIQP